MMRHKVIYVMSTNFAGSTVLGLVLGSNPQAMFLGEPATIVRRDALGRWKHKRFCSICQDDWQVNCPIWTPHVIAKVRENSGCIYDLLAANSSQGRFFVDSSKSLPWLISGIESGHVDASVVQISKAVRRYTASVLTRQRWPQLLESIGLDWAQTNRAIRLFAEERKLPYMHIRYEDFATHFDEVMKRLEPFVGFEYHETQRQFWTHPHHYIKGNSGTFTHFDSKRIEVEPGLNRELYKQNHQTIFLDEKWKELLSPHALNRLFSVPDVETETRILGHEPPDFVHPSPAQRLRGRVVAKAIQACRRI